MHERIEFRHIEVASSGQSEARLVLFDGKLVAVITLLDETLEELAGRWYAEAAFNGLDDMKYETFGSLADVAAWIQAHLPR